MTFAEGIVIGVISCVTFIFIVKFLWALFKVKVDDLVVEYMSRFNRRIEDRIDIIESKMEDEDE